MMPDRVIDPELYGLLDEVVTDPRSALRLTPRKALLHWFDGGERLRAPIDATRAEKHLLEVHREALAELLIQASRIAYWKAPDMGIVPRRADGSTPFRGPAPEELGPRIEVCLRAYPKVGCPELAALVTQPPKRSHALPLAVAALALVPSDEARHAVAVATPWDQPRTALAVLDSLAGRIRLADSAACVSSMRGARLCSLARLPEAFEAYLRCRDLAEIAAIVEYYVLNLSCYLENEEGARVSAKRLQDAPWLQQFRQSQFPILVAFARSMGPDSVRKARRVARTHSESSHAAATVNEALS